jgi:xylitol oxidase
MTASAAPLATWAGTHTFTAPRLTEATSVEQVQDAVRTRVGRVRALGTRHSFNDLADTDGTLVTVTGIDPAPLLDEAARTVTVGGGTRYGVLAAWLEEHDWALHNMGSLPHISVAGATATGTHGSGVTLGNLSTAVRALEFVGADGELHTVTPDDPDFAGHVVHLGAIGVVTRVTLAIEPSYQVRQDIYADLPWEELLGDVEGVMRSGYSVSVFTHWATPTVEAVLRKTRLDRGSEPDLPRRWRGAELAERLTLIETDGWTDAAGLPGPWLLRLPHFRLDRTPSAGDEIQSEYFVDRRQGAEALRAVRELGERIDPHLILSELRTMAADDLWLSGAEGRDTLAIHFTWKPHPDAVAGLLPDIERALAPFAARPHWGKWHRFDAERIAAVFPRAADARALFGRVDPEGVFRNPHLEGLWGSSPVE